GILSLEGGKWEQNSASLPTLSAGDFRLGGSTSFLRVKGGDGTSATPYQVADVYGLQGLNTLLGGSLNVVLANSIDAVGSTNWNAGQGFKPIGQEDGYFSGVFDGNNKSISGLTVSTTYGNAGLFGNIGQNSTVRDLTLSGSVSGSGWAGGLAAYV